MISTQEPLARVAVSHRGFLAVCATAGGLAVPPHAVATPVAAAATALLGILGLRTWGWSRLPLPTSAPRSLSERFVHAILWMGVGLGMGLVLLAVIRLVIAPLLPEIGVRIARAGTLAVWRRVIIIYVAAVAEEILFRLILLSAIAGLLARLSRHPDRIPHVRDIWIANTLSALAFAVVHLPAWSGAAAMSIGLGASILALNAAAGLVLGGIFVKRGIVLAMWAHAGGDCAIQLLGPVTG
jgi:membrane protease YdiL (CAAX protease family)